eukprot:TRINITY_DN10129_c0_g1_i1.p1 TRINITY_DN10129_c0_g1~~TRINITY_DN10129_c0_g1_i1.p1  ORF type:complete len:530 (+),score=113.71 TRINITY_DN10129_c0_g1_i1:74-1663(+)
MVRRSDSRSSGSKTRTIVTLDTPRIELEMLERDKNPGRPRTKSRKQELQMMIINEFEDTQEKGRISYELSYDQGRLIRNSFCLLSASIGAIFSIAAAFISWDGKQQVSADSAEVLRLLSSLCSVLLVFQIGEYHRFKVTSVFQHYVKDTIIPWTAFSKDLPILLLEVTVCLWHIPPFCGDFLPDKWMFPMFLRTYLVLRFFRDVSPITRNKGRIISHGFYHLGGTSFNSWIFHARTFVYREPGRLIIITTGVIFMIMSFCIYLFEREEQPDIFDYGNSLWYTAVAMTTVGYGDIVARTDLGRLFAILSGALGIFLSSFCVTVASSVLTLSRHQKFANDIVSWQDLEKKRLHSAATVIQAWWKLIKLEQDGVADPMATYKYRKMLLEATGSLRRHRRIRKNLSAYGDDSVLMTRLLLEGRFDPILDRILRVEKTASALDKKMRMLTTPVVENPATPTKPTNQRFRISSIITASSLNLTTTSTSPSMSTSPPRQEIDHFSKILSRLETFDRRLQSVENIVLESTPSGFPQP